MKIQISLFMISALSAGGVLAQAPKFAPPAMQSWSSYTLKYETSGGKPGAESSELKIQKNKLVLISLTVSGLVYRDVLNPKEFDKFSQLLTQSPLPKAGRAEEKKKSVADHRREVWTLEVGQRSHQASFTEPFPAAYADLRKACDEIVADMKAPVGDAFMGQDGTIVMSLRAKGPGAQVGDAQVLFPKSHKEYQAVLQHLGGLKPGESKLVPPWPSK